MIADYLAAAYSQKMQLSGIIYLHPISDNRFTHHMAKNLEMFKKLTGQKNLKNVVLTTSMWDRVGEVEGGRREIQLRENYWNLLLAFGAKMARFDGTADGAREIAATLAANHEPFYVQLQEEMGKGHKSLKDTAAGQEIVSTKKKKIKLISCLSRSVILEPSTRYGEKPHANLFLLHRCRSWPGCERSTRRSSVR